MPNLNLDGLIAYAKKHGMQAVELRMARWQHHDVSEALSPAERSHVRAAFTATAGIRFVALGSPLRLDADEDPARLANALALCRDCGADFLRIFIAERANPADFLARECFRSLAARFGVRVAVENHASVARLTDLARLVGEFDLLWDIGQSLRAGERIAAIPEHVLARVKHVHVKAGHMESGQWRETSLREGADNIRAMAEQLRKARYRGVLSLEVAPEFLAPALYWLRAFADENVAGCALSKTVSLS